MDVSLLGCRRSNPATGPESPRCGGDTSFVAVARTGDAPRPAFRVTTGDASLACIPDDRLTEAESEPVDLVTGVDLLLHESQHLDAELQGKAFLGHSSVEYVTDLAGRTDVRSSASFHHDPARTAVTEGRMPAECDAFDVQLTATATGGRYRL